MAYSIGTSRGQTTIPKIIRLFLGIEPMDKSVYVIDNGKVVLEHVSGDILELKGALKHEKGKIEKGEKMKKE